jgi:hypothetical protein
MARPTAATRSAGLSTATAFSPVTAAVTSEVGGAAEQAIAARGSTSRPAARQATPDLSRNLSRVAFFAGSAGLEQLIELAATQSHEHGLVLLLHQPADLLGELFLAELSVRDLRVQDAATISEQVRDDVRMFDSRVFGLMKHDRGLTLLLAELRRVSSPVFRGSSG